MSWQDRIVIDPAHDFGKNTYHSLEVTRRLPEMVATGWPVLVSLSNKDFVGETLGGLPPGERLTGTALRRVAGRREALPQSRSRRRLYSRPARRARPARPGR